ncbi:helix-turn-helix domain-containing protein, partial [Streptococcus sp. DD10]
MAYGIDFRKRVLAYVEEGHTRQETAKLFNISTNTLYSTIFKKTTLSIV